MKNTFLILILAFSPNLFAKTNTDLSSEEEKNYEHHDYIFTPEEETEFLKETSDNDEFSLLFRFPQTSWRECREEVTGNYIQYQCSSGRKISKILKSFMFKHFQSCINESLSTLGLSKAVDTHVTHIGILGDPNHKPRSLHSESRAIDVDSFIVELENKSFKTIKYKSITNRSFFTKFRQCWGERVNKYNGCPYINGKPLLTGSIGWEDSHHKNHLHVSIPYCVNGQYAGNYNKR